jgi:hypothetical protein
MSSYTETRQQLRSTPQKWVVTEEQAARSIFIGGDITDLPHLPGAEFTMSIFPEGSVRRTSPDLKMPCLARRNSGLK